MITVFISTHFFLATSFFSPISVKLTLLFTVRVAQICKISALNHTFWRRKCNTKIFSQWFVIFCFSFLEKLFATFEDRVPLTVHLA